MSSLTWGEIEAGKSSTLRIYVKNNGDASVVLSLATDNWNSKDSKDNMSLSWDYTGSKIQPNEVRAINLILNVNPDCPELSSFGFDVIIIGT